MPHATPSRAAHRATADGGLALLVKSAATGGQHRHQPAMGRSRPAPRPRSRAARAEGIGVEQLLLGGARVGRRARPEPQRGPQLLTRGLAAAILAALAGLLCFVVLADKPPRPAPRTGAPDDLIASRAADPAPLTLQEVFGDPEQVLPESAAAPYRITMTHIDTECAIATTGTLGALLEEHGCDQVVRAAMTAPYGGYQVTAGMFNLTDAAGADTVDAALRGLVETGDGSLAAMTGGLPGADRSAPPTAQVGWYARGHYLLYCVITSPDGRLVTGDDPYAQRITAELVDAYLSGSVLGRRASSA